MGLPNTILNSTSLCRIIAHHPCLKRMDCLLHLLKQHHKCSNNMQHTWGKCNLLRRLLQIHMHSQLMGILLPNMRSKPQALCTEQQVEQPRHNQEEACATVCLLAVYSQRCSQTT